MYIDWTGLLLLLAVGHATTPLSVSRNRAFLLCANLCLLKVAQLVDVGDSTDESIPPSLSVASETVCTVVTLYVT